ncbi:MAG: alpha/beta fold hydrolase [Saprospiraceae bacterium]|nr:alpha/beta fold hydrolase [Saprospiraceae bacterium]
MRKAKKILVYSISGVLCYGVLILGVYLFQDFFVYQPQELFVTSELDFDLPHQDVWLETADGEKIHGLFFETHLSDRKGVVLYLHGNRGHLGRWGQYQEAFTSRGYDFFAIDYRGFGKSTGTPTEEGLYIDASAAYRWLSERYPAGDIVIYGRSLGSGVASHLAASYPARMLILETPYSDIKSVFEHNAPLLYLPFPLRAEFPNKDYLNRVPFPVYIFHGTQDELISYDSASDLKESLKAADRFITIRGGRHGNLADFPHYHFHLDQILGPNHWAAPES